MAYIVEIYSELSKMWMKHADAQMRPIEYTTREEAETYARLVQHDERRLARVSERPAGTV